MTLVATQSTSWLEEESSATAGKWGYLALKSNKGTVGGIIDDYCWSVCVDSQNKEAAGEFVKFFTDTDAQKYFTQSPAPAAPLRRIMRIPSCKSPFPCFLLCLKF